MEDLVTVGGQLVPITNIGSFIASMEVVGSRILLSKGQECYYTYPEAAYLRAMIDDSIMKGIIGGEIQSMHHDETHVHDDLTCIILVGQRHICTKIVELNNEYLKELGFRY